VSLKILGLIFPQTKPFTKRQNGFQKFVARTTQGTAPQQRSNLFKKKKKKKQFRFPLLLGVCSEMFGAQIARGQTNSSASTFLPNHENLHQSHQSSHGASAKTLFHKNVFFFFKKKENSSEYVPVNIIFLHVASVRLFHQTEFNTVSALNNLNRN
jgi:hypothetical protein